MRNVFLILGIFFFATAAIPEDTDTSVVTLSYKQVDDAYSNPSSASNVDRCVNALPFMVVFVKLDKNQQDAAHVADLKHAIEKCQQLIAATPPVPTNNNGVTEWRYYQNTDGTNVNADWAIKASDSQAMQQAVGTFIHKMADKDGTDLNDPALKKEQQDMKLFLKSTDLKKALANFKDQQTATPAGGNGGQ